MYPLVVLGSLICINSGLDLIVVEVNSSAGSWISEISTIKGGKYVPAVGVVFIVSINSDNTSSNRNKLIKIVGASNSEGKSSNKAAT